MLAQFKPLCLPGITLTCPGFYAPQGRNLRLSPVVPDLIEQFSQFKTNSYQITNFEMETAAIYGLGRALGHRCLSLSAIVAHRLTGEFSIQASKTVDKLIRLLLEQITKIPY